MIKSIKVKCIKSTGGAFMKGQIYNASMSDGDWCVKGVDDYSYTTLRGMWGTIYYCSLDRKVRFTFEPVEKEDLE
ncbi:hypothetical protein BI040_gp16 [Escherichia phage vB_EcoS_NBD2]|uniref:Uncharacterized protein n=1 Tax=Escherichia phage vB_EcoS_NBD2 TaxID=1852563 RepID=A0A192Y8A6_9CAUD|nr:hypothetical protein BI040_gp16 [Escherichia phage vB_EcoS_NBD2]ANM45858.1 hypothetical protein NBD2_16 [Escherichia phage vB_EcoS_NBD2]